MPRRRHQRRTPIHRRVIARFRRGFALPMVLLLLLISGMTIVVYMILMFMIFTAGT